jgi:hypothetical protein
MKGGRRSATPRRAAKSTAQAPGESNTRRGRLKYGNPSGDLTTAVQCGARTRRGTACQGPAMRNGRCRMHGGLSTGPRTPEGRERSTRARWKHGRYSEEARREFRRLKAEGAAYNAAVRARWPMLRQLLPTKRGPRS